MNIRWAVRLDIFPCPLLLMPPQQFGGFLHPNHAVSPFCCKRPSTKMALPTVRQTEKHLFYLPFSVSRKRLLNQVPRPNKPRTEFAKSGIQSSQLHCPRVLRLPCSRFSYIPPCEIIFK